MQISAREIQQIRRVRYVFDGPPNNLCGVYTSTSDHLFIHIHIVSFSLTVQQNLKS
jgi:hypothetical protein